MMNPEPASSAAMTRMHYHNRSVLLSPALTAESKVVAYEHRRRVCPRDGSRIARARGGFISLSQS
jgi:hypothetical protein